MDPLQTNGSAPDSELRLKALEAYGVMDTPPEQAFDDLTRLTSFICGTPIALITLLDKRRQWFKSTVGITVQETLLEHAFCAHAIQQEKIFLVPDASKDSRFSENPLVTGDPHIRFYAGAPLLTPEGIPLGTLCAIDREPHSLTNDQAEALSALARQVMQNLELRRTTYALRLAMEEKHAVKQELATLKDLLPMCAWCRKVRDEQSFWQNVETYLSSHNHIQYTHGICPECAANFKAETEKMLQS